MTRLAAAALAVSALLADAAPARGLRPSDDRDAASASLRGLPQCVAFAWVSAGKGRPRGAMTVPIGIDGRQLTVQLDTGADVSMIYGDIADKAGWVARGERFFLAHRLTIGTTSITRPNVQANRDMTADEVQGTLGLPELVGRVAVIDYPGQRFCLFDDADVPEPIRRARLVSASLRNAKLWLPLRIGDVKSDAILFDTGSSEMPLRVDAANWTKMTGVADGKNATARFTGRAWGKPISFDGASARTAMMLGDIDLGRPTVFTDPSDPASFAGWPFRADGIIGNAPFWEGVVVLDLTARMRFGFI